MSGDYDRRGWDWVRFVPESTWVVPNDIKGPTAVPSTNLFMAIMVSDLIGNGVMEAVGELIAECARFNMWYATAVDGRVGSERQAALYTIYRDLEQRIYEPWAAYQRACAAEVVDMEDHAREEHDALLDALRAMRQDLFEARHSLDDER